MKLENKAALITGAGSGMGRESALLFSQEGAKICVVDLDDKSGMQTVEMIKRSSGEAFFVHADVSNADDAKKMIQETVDKFGKIDILFNNAGIPMAPTPVEKIEEYFWVKTMDINVKGIFLGCKYAVPEMKKQGKGVIINTASATGVRPQPFFSAYAASKAAVIMLTKALSKELASHQIRVNCLTPASTDTQMLPKFIDDSGVRDEKYEKEIQQYIEAMPLGRLISVQDIARAALFLVSDDAASITGVSLKVDSGRCV